VVKDIVRAGEKKLRITTHFKNRQIQILQITCNRAAELLWLQCMSEWLYLIQYATQRIASKKHAALLAHPDFRKTRHFTPCRLIFGLICLH